MPDTWSVLQGEGAGSPDEAVRDFVLHDGGGERVENENEDVPLIHLPPAVLVAKLEGKIELVAWADREVQRLTAERAEERAQHAEAMKRLDEAVKRHDEATKRLDERIVEWKEATDRHISAYERLLEPITDRLPAPMSKKPKHPEWKEAPAKERIVEPGATVVLGDGDDSAE